MTETIQEIYEKSHNEEYDNIPIRDMQMRIENKINLIVQKYLEEIGLKYDYDSERYKGEITDIEYDPKNEMNNEVEYNIILTLKSIDVKIESVHPKLFYD